MIDAVLGSRYSHHFYTEAERAEIRRRWRRAGVDLLESTAVTEPFICGKQVVSRPSLRSSGAGARQKPNSPSLADMLCRELGWSGQI